MQLQSYFNDILQYCASIENVELRNAVEDLAKNGTSLEKTQAITVVAAVKKFKLK